MQGCRWIDMEELKRRRHEWRELAVNGEFPSVFADPAWVMAWWRIYGGDREPWCHLLEDSDGSMQGLVLLARGLTPFSRTLTFAGDTWNGIETLICAPGREAELGASLMEALTERRNQWDIWRVQRLRVDSAFGRMLLDGENPLRAATHDLRLQPFIELPGDVATFEASFGAKERGAQRRKWRRLSELGATARLVSDPEGAVSTLHVLLNLRRQRAIALNQRHAHMDERYERFLVEVVRELLPDGAHLWTLEQDGEILASSLHFVRGSREHTYLQGIAEKHVNLSPGNSLELHAIREAIGEGRTEFELGPGRDEYKYRLGARDREFTRLVVASPSPRGRIVGASAAVDLRLRNTAAAEALRRRLGITSERAATGSSSQPVPVNKPSAPR